MLPVTTTTSTAAPTPAPATLSFFAGTGVQGPGVVGPATSSTLWWPKSTAVDTAGNVYIADSNNARIEKVDTSGNLTFVAGTGSSGAPVSGPATSSPLNGPSGVATDSSGNLYISDSNNHRIEKVDSSGNLTVIAGTGTQGTAATATSNVAATTSNLNFPRSLAVDSAGNVYFADSGNHRIAKIDTGGTLTTVAGNGTRGAPTAGAATSSPLNTPAAIAIDSAGNIYSGGTDKRVYKISPSGNLTFVAGTGTGGAATAGSALSSNLSSIQGVAVDGTGNVYIADTSNHRIEKVDTSGNLSFIAGTGSSGSPTAGPATASSFNSVNSVSVGTGGVLYATDTFNNRVHAITLPAGSVPTVTSSAPTSATVSTAFSTTLTASGVPSPTWTVASGALPSWLSLNAGTGVLSGNAPASTGPVPAFTVRATNSAGYDEQTVNLTVNPVITTPAAPSSVRAAGGDTSATVTWSAPSSNGGAAITGYTVTATPGGATCAALTAPCTVSGLTNGIPYTFTVTAANSAGAGPASTPSAPTTPAALGGGGSSSSGLPPQVLTANAPKMLPLKARTAALNVIAAGKVTYSSSSPSVCIVDAAGVITALAPGTCSIMINAAATETRAAASQALSVTITTPESTTSALPSGPRRLAGPDRIATSAGVAQEVFSTPTLGSSHDVVLSGAGLYADSLAGARLAGQIGGPLLLTDGDRLSPETAGQIRRLVRAGGTVYLLGGDAAISEGVEQAVNELVQGDTVVRAGGADRYATAVAIAAATTQRAGDVGPIYLVTGRDFADGVSVAAFAQSTGGVVLLTDGDRMPRATADYLGRHDPQGDRAVAIGGPAKAAAVKAGLDGAADRAVTGIDRFETSAKLAAAMRASSGDISSVGLAGGASWPDALPGAAAMAALGGPLLLTATGVDEVPVMTTRAVAETGATRLVAFGGKKVITEKAYEAISANLAR
nr:cell wall-binding repeat-containing protein [Quadrisphaera sp. RL12-1S]